MHTIVRDLIRARNMITNFTERGMSLMTKEDISSFFDDLAVVTGRVVKQGINELLPHMDDITSPSHIQKDAMDSANESFDKLKALELESSALKNDLLSIIDNNQIIHFSIIDRIEQLSEDLINTAKVFNSAIKLTAPPVNYEEYAPTM